MANSDIKAASYIFDGDGVLTHLQVDGKQYGIADLKHTPSGGGQAITLEGDKLTAAITKATEGLPKEAPLSAVKFDHLHGFANQHKAIFEGGAHPLQHIVDAEPFAAAYKTAAQGGSKDGLIKLMVNEAEHGAHLKYVPEEHVTVFRRAMEAEKAGSFAALKTNLKDGRAISEKLVGINFSDAKFDAAGAVDKEIERILGGHHTKERPVGELKGFISEEAHAHVKASGSSYTGVDHAIRGFGDKVDASRKLLTTEADKLQQLRKQQKSIIPSRAATKANLAEQIKTVESNIAAHLEGSAAHGVAYNSLPDHVRKTLDSSALIKTAGTKAASEIGGEVSKGPGFVSKLFLKSEAEIAEKGISGIKKLHFGKAAGWAAGVVAVAYLAGVGRNPDKGKYTEQALASQGQQASVGVA